MDLSEAAKKHQEMVYSQVVVTFPEWEPIASLERGLITPAPTVYRTTSG